MIFQEPMTSLNPLHTIEKQIAESLKLHRDLSGRAALDRILELLDLTSLVFATQSKGLRLIRMNYPVASGNE